jgi:hypothetical protein
MADNAHITALVKAQAAMGKLTKNSTNPHFKSKYADLGAVLETCSEVLHANGFAILQPSGKDDMGQFTDTTLAHESGGQFTTRVYWTGVKPDMQGSGSAMTYARRYGLMALTALAPEDDDGVEASKPAPKREAPAHQPVAQPAETLTPAASRDRMLAALKDAVTAKQFTGLIERQTFKDALAALAEAAPPMALQVTAEIDKLRSKLVIDDSLPEFLSTANGEDQQ